MKHAADAPEVSRTFAKNLPVILDSHIPRDQGVDDHAIWITFVIGYLMTRMLARVEMPGLFHKLIVLTEI